MSQLDIIATINSHMFNSDIFERMAKDGATIFRLNGSHVNVNEVERYVTAVRQKVGNKVKILMDLPGNKIRTANITQPIPLEIGKEFTLYAEQINYPSFLKTLVPGDILLANDSLLKFKVISVGTDSVRLYSYNDGNLLNNKGIHLHGRYPKLPILFDKDKQLIEAAKKFKVDLLGVSFVRFASEVEEVKSIAGDCKLIVKLETNEAIENIDTILKTNDAFLIDRGDLSCDVGIENIFSAQKFIHRKCKENGKRIFFATQFFFSMVQNPTPLISESHGISDVLSWGADGIQLSEETAIGKYPLEILQFIGRIQKKYNSEVQKKVNTYWFTGRSGSGKTSITKMIQNYFESIGRTVCVIDGDEYREFLNNEIGFTKEDRLKNQKNIAYLAFKASHNFDLVMVSSLSPFRESREFARSKINNFHEIYVKCSLESCQKRDPKKLYAKSNQNQIKDFAISSTDYEEPLKPDFVIDTDENNLDGSYQKTKEYILKNERL